MGPGVAVGVLSAIVGVSVPAVLTWGRQLFVRGLHLHLLFDFFLGGVSLGGLLLVAYSVGRTAHGWMASRPPLCSLLRVISSVVR